jgi:hypothetical protein
MVSSANEAITTEREHSLLKSRISAWSAGARAFGDNILRCFNKSETAAFLGAAG